jgi:hypothetical protein
MFNLSFLNVKIIFSSLFCLCLLCQILNKRNENKINRISMPYRQIILWQQHTSWTKLISSFFFSVWVFFFRFSFFLVFFLVVVVVVVFWPSGKEKRTEIWIYSRSILDYLMTFTIANKKKKTRLLPIDNHLRLSLEINKEFNQYIVYYFIEPYKWSYFLFFLMQKTEEFFFFYRLMILERNRTLNAMTENDISA